MFLKTQMKKCISALITTALVISQGAAAFAAPSGGSDTAKLIFSGVTMQSKNNTVQGFLDVNIRNIENNGVAFTLEYNTDYVQLSDAENNSEDAVADFEASLGGKGFNNIEDDGKKAPNFLEYNDSVISGEDAIVSGDLNRTDGKYGNLKLNFAIAAWAPDSQYIKTVPTEPDWGSGSSPTKKVFNTGNSELKILRISFNIKDPAQFAKLTSAELAKVFRVQEDENGNSIFEISYVNTAVYPYLFEYSQSQYLDYEFEVVNPIESVTLNTPSMTVNAAEIYNSDSEADITRWLNLYMNDITIRYADGTTIADTIVWGDTAKGYTIGGDSYNVKGGTSYTITQKYNEDKTVSADLKVLPVNVTGYYVDDEFDQINYSTAADTTSPVPGDITDPAMKLPAEARPIFDKMISGAGSYKVGVGTDWTISEVTGGAVTPVNSDVFFIYKTKGKYMFSAEPNTAELPRWATFDTDMSVDVIRGIDFEVTPAPDSTNVTASVDDTGTMTVTAGAIGTISPLTADIDFIVKLPNGETINKSIVEAGGGTFDITLNSPADGSAVIKIKAGDTSDGLQERLAQYINLGSRGGRFGLAAQNGEALRSSFTSFAPDPRNNYYTAKADGTDYVFDYSGVKASLFPFAAGTDRKPPTTITLAGGDTVSTTYAGDSGSMPGALITIAVRGWTMTEGNTSSPGSIVVFKGMLEDTSYTDYGRVTNSSNIEVTLKLTVSEENEPEEEKIADIEDFVFDKKQVGYSASDLEAKTFTIENIGNVDIKGLSVSIGGRDADSFTVRGKPPYLLSQGAASSFTIIPKTGLDVGEYTATVTINSNRTSGLDTFTVTFRVAEGIVYDLELTKNADTWGEVSAKDGYGYEAGETVSISAVPEEDYVFVNWQVINEDLKTVITFAPDANTTSASFVMPDMADYEGTRVTIQANFSETGRAQLRLADLKELENDSTGTENNLLDSTFKKISFDEKITDYYVVTGSLSEENKAYFKLKNTEVRQSDGSTIPVTVDVTIATKAGISGTPGASAGVTVSEHSGETGAYDTDVFALESAPTVQVLKITLTAGEDTRDYTVNIIRRLTSSELIDFGYGNSPYGLIMRDENITDKDEAKRAFTEDNHNKFVEGFETTPEGAHTGIMYSTDAWGTGSDAYNYDRDDTALFVYNGDTFTDPGITAVKNSIGADVDAGSVKRSVKLQVMAKEKPSTLLADLRDITETAYNLSSDITAEEIMIRDNRVRPGVYTIEYRFKDFDGTEVTAGRPLIVLFGRGDVNLDKNVTEDDVNLVHARLSQALPYGKMQGYEAGSMLCIYRICDANNDRNLNVGDVNYIRRNMSNMTQFYK